MIFLGVTLSQKDQPQQEEYLCYHDKSIDNTNNQITYVLELFSFKSILILEILFFTFFMLMQFITKKYGFFIDKVF